MGMPAGLSTHSLVILYTVLCPSWDSRKGQTTPTGSVWKYDQICAVCSFSETRRLLIGPRPVPRDPAKRHPATLLEQFERHTPARSSGRVASSGRSGLPLHEDTHIDAFAPSPGRVSAGRETSIIVCGAGPSWWWGLCQPWCRQADGCCTPFSQVTTATHCRAPLAVCRARARGERRKERPPPAPVQMVRDDGWRCAG